MDLNLAGIYAASIKGLKSNPLIYLLLLLWGLLQGIVLLVILSIGGVLWLSSVAAEALSNSGSGKAASIIVLTAIYAGVSLLLTLLGAVTRAGVLGFGSRIRETGHATTLDFVKGIFRFTFPLFIGGLIVGMLSAIPALLYLVFVRFTLGDITSDILTSGWNFPHMVRLLGYLWNMLLAAGVFQAVIFFWIAPWDEMVVLYEIPFSEALGRSFTFVFSRRNFLRVVVLVLANVLIAQAAMILGNLGAFMAAFPTSLALAWFHAAFNLHGSGLASFFQFLLFPFFAFSQLYLLPLPQVATPSEPTQSLIALTAHETAGSA